MKRVAVIAIFMAVMASLFAFPVFGTTYSPDTYNTYSDSVTYNGVTYYVRATQLKALSTGTSMLPGGMETIILIQLQMTNNNSSAASATIPKFNIDLRDSGSIITDVYTYGGDFTLGILSGGNGIFYPSSDFADGNNKVIVPPGKSLYCVGAIGLPAQLDQTGSSTLDNGLRGVHLYDKSNYQVTIGSYSYGNPVDLSPVISYIDGIESALNTSNNNTSTIINRLNSIISLLTYSGNTYSEGVDAALVYDSTQTDTSVSGFTYRVYRTVTPSSYIDNTIYYDAANDVYYQNGTKERIQYLRVVLTNTSDNTVRLSRVISLNNFLASGSTTYDISYDSDIFDCYWYGDNSSSTSARRLYMMFVNNDGTYGYIPAHSTFTLNIIVCYRYNDNQTLTFYNPAWSSLSPTIDNSGSYFPKNVYEILREWIMSYKSVNGLDDIDDNTDEITDKSETAHTQEQSYFTQNAQAIESTGLSNYRFNGDQENGIGSVSHDFTLLWNALGGFNSVYIFSLTLSLALMVLRHAPGVIRSSRRNKEE